MVGLASTLPLPSSFRSCEVGAARRVSRNSSEASRPAKVALAPSVKPTSQTEVGMTAAISGKISRTGWKACPERAISFIRTRYPVKTAESVAADTGIGAETVKKWLDGSARPSWDACWALICAYGTPFMIATILTKPVWLDEAHRRERLAALEAAQARIAAEIAELV